MAPLRQSHTFRHRPTVGFLVFSTSCLKMVSRAQPPHLLLSRSDFPGLSKQSGQSRAPLCRNRLSRSKFRVMASLAPPGLLSREEMRLWRHPRNSRVFWDLGSIWLQVILSWGFCFLYPEATVYFLSWLLIGGAQHGMGLVAHEGAHALLFPGSRLLNDRVTKWFFASPVCLPFSVYRERHFTHHRMVSTDQDTKELYQREYRGVGLIWEVIRSLSGWEFFATAAKVLMRLKKSAEKRSSKSDPLGDFQSIVFCQAIIFLIVGGLVNYILFWFVPLATTAQLFSKIRSVVEHRPLESHSGSGNVFFMGTETPYLRSVDAALWERLFLTRLNFHFHAEHHMWPQISYQYLPILHQRLRQRDDHIAVFDDSYLSAIGKLWRGV